MSGIVHYEVYVFQSNTWDLLARYPAEQRTNAIEYAKSVERSDHCPTKVVKESYDLNTQTFHEALVYLSEIPKNQEKKSNPYANSSLPSPKAAQSKQKKGNATESIMMLFLAMLFSIIVAGVLTTGILHFTAASNFLPQYITQQFILGIFTFFFLALSIPTSAKWVNWNAFFQDDLTNDTVGKRSHLPSDRKFNFSNKDLYGSDKNKESTSSSLLSRIMENIFDSFDVLIGRKPFSLRTAEEKKEEEENTENTEKANTETTDTSSETESNTKEEEEKEDQIKQLDNESEKEPEEQEKSTEEQEKEPEKENDKVTIPPELEQNYFKMTAFLSIILRVLQNKKMLLNTYTRFGLELFLAGACEHMCEADNLSKEQNRIILSGLLTLLGRSVTLADIFFYKLDEYVLEPKYLPMIESGEEGMRIYLGNSSSPELITLIQSAMETWKNPDLKEQKSSGICTIMFTDMVSSTHLTQTLGDHLAQELVRLHNSIVRKALKNCGGTEVKHTGDGIMASFLWASNAIDAAIAIQQAVIVHNRQTPTVPLEIRIGLNSGEPIVEDNDFFGSTVQMASRICGQAGAGQIYVSSVVKELSSGKKYLFNSLGDFRLKGIDEPQPLYEVVWNLLAESDPAVPQTAASAEKNLSETLPEF